MYNKKLCFVIYVLIFKKRERIKILFKRKNKILFAPTFKSTTLWRHLTSLVIKINGDEMLLTVLKSCESCFLFYLCIYFIVKKKEKKKVENVMLNVENVIQNTNKLYGRDAKVKLESFEKKKT